MTTVSDKFSRVDDLTALQIAEHARQARMYGSSKPEDGIAARLDYIILLLERMAQPQNITVQAQVDSKGVVDAVINAVANMQRVS